MNRSTSAFIIAIVLPWLGLAPTCGAPAMSLPKIRIANAGRAFTTAEGRPFVPFGVNYYRPGTGWAPQVWKQFDAQATRADFARMKELGVNCVRVFLSFGSFYRTAGALSPEGLAKFDEFLELAEQAGIYVHPTGPDHWEGPPEWGLVAVEDEKTVQALEGFWRLFAGRYRGRNVLFAYDLRNEPEVGWNERMLPRWNDWLRKKYGTADRLAAAWATAHPVELGSLPLPPEQDTLKDRRLLDFQAFREDLADDWTRRQAEAIRSVDPEALVTVGLIQWSVPAVLPGSIRYYSAFRPERQARYLDFLEIHFYPLARGAYEYRTAEDELANLAYLESILREVAKPGKPVVLAEFGWYGGGKPSFDNGRHPPATEEQQARYCRRVVETSAGLVTGWLNWGFYDQPEASDCSQLTGLATADGKIKVWGRTFKELQTRLGGQKFAAPNPSPRPSLDWEAATTSIAAGQEFCRRYLEAYSKEVRTDGANKGQPAARP